MLHFKPYFFPNYTLWLLTLWFIDFIMCKVELIQKLAKVKH